MQNYHHNAYKAASFREESKTRQVVMLYEGAIKFVRQARQAIEENNIEDRFNNISKACDILVGLQLSLNFEDGGDVARLLYDYYAGMDMILSNQHFKPDIRQCDSVLNNLTLMKEAWEDVHTTMQSKLQEKEANNQIMAKLKEMANPTAEVTASATIPNADLLASINFSA